jgi:hypothetical protein
MFQSAFLFAVSGSYFAKFLSTLTMAIVTALMPAANQATGYAFPLRADGLAGDERYYTDVHLSGPQGLGNDIIAKRFTGDVTWVDFTPTNNKPEDNASRVVYGKAFYAMEDGVVVGCWRNAPENLPGSLHPYFQQKKYAGGGNHLWILQKDSVYALYAHAKPGSISSSLCPHSDSVFATLADTTPHFPDIDSHVEVANGASVKKGQFLGYVGNSGASSDFPHLHVHMEKNGKAWPMKFERGMTAIYNNVSPRGPWTRLAGNELPKQKILVWAPHTLVSNLSWAGIKDTDYQLMFDHFTDSGFMIGTATCGMVNNALTYHVNWTPAVGTWVSWAAMTDADFIQKKTGVLQQGYHQTSSYTCGTPAGNRTVAVFRK